MMRVGSGVEFKSAGLFMRRRRGNFGRRKEKVLVRCIRSGANFWWATILSGQVLPMH
jgi:hypothetical protein